MLVAFSFSERFEARLRAILSDGTEGPAAWPVGKSPVLAVARIFAARPSDLTSLGFLEGANGLDDGFPPGARGFLDAVDGDRIALRVAGIALVWLGERCHRLETSRPRRLDWQAAIGVGLAKVRGATSGPYGARADRLLRSGAFLATGWLIDREHGRRDRGDGEIAEQLGREAAACEILARLIEGFAAEVSEVEEVGA